MGETSNMLIAITGATGFVGSRLVEVLQADGHRIKVFTRNPDRAQRVFPASAFPQVEIVGYTPLQAGDWQAAIAGCDSIVNLAGDPIADGRWTPERKRSILQSRQQSTEQLVAAIAQAQPRPGVLVNASAIGFYGTSETATFDETSAPIEQDFLSQVSQTWEQAAQGVEALGLRLVILRFGIVLGAGGALAKMVPPFRLFAGGTIGSGQQWFSWIHREDLVRLIVKALMEPQMQGVYNATAPNPVRMQELCDTLGAVMHRPSWLPVPDFVLEVLLGDAAQAVLKGQQVLPQRTLATGFEYQYSQLKPAIADVIAKLG